MSIPIIIFSKEKLAKLRKKKIAKFVLDQAVFKVWSVDPWWLQRPFLGGSEKSKPFTK